MFTGTLLAQQDVTGVVTSDTGETLPGVTVLVKGTNNGVVTDFDGNYAISVSNSDAVLVVSFIGMETQEVTVGSQSKIDVALVTSAEMIDEVVITALGLSRDKKSLGYSVGEVAGEDLQAVPQENVLNAMAGKVSGVAISSTGGPGSSVSMVIRGASSLNTDNQPLFVIDGVPVANTLNNVGGMGSGMVVDYGNAISDMNPNDIESVSVLKGPSASALYGSRAANGVVIVTTKTGKSGKGMGVSISSSTVFDVPFKYLEKHKYFAYGSRPYTPDNNPGNSDLEINYTTAGWVGPELDKGYSAVQWPYSAQELESGVPELKPLTSQGANNAEEFFETAITSTNSVSIEDNTDTVAYRLSYTNMTHTGFIPNTDLGRDNISLNSSVQLNDKFKVSSSLNYTKSGAKNRPGGDRNGNPIQALYDINPSLDINDMKDYWREGFEGLKQNAPYNWGDDADDFDYNNPYFLANEVNNGFERNRVFGNVKAEYQFNDKFTLMARYNYDETGETRETKISSGFRRERNGFYGVQNIKNQEINTDWLLSYNDQFGDDWSLNASAGGNMMKRKSSQISTQSKNGGAGLIVPNVFTISNIAFDNLQYSQRSEKRQINSLYALASLGYKNIAYLDVTARNDWSSTLPEENNSYFYPSFSGSVLLNNIFELGDNISLFKLRAGYAEVGNDANPYSLYPVLGNSGAWGSAVQLNQPGTILSPNLEPERQTSIEFGTDVALFQNRLRADFTYYEADNENQIFGVGIPASTGYSNKNINAGLITSKGIDASIGGTIITNEDWNWDATAVFSTNSTKIVELAEGIDFVNFWRQAKGGAYTWVGEEVGNIIDRAMVRVEDENSQYFGWPLLDDEGWENDDSTLQDADGNRVAPIIGNYNPDFMLGLQTQVSYKNWSLAMSFDWRSGGQFVSQTHRYYESDLQTERWIDKLYDLSDVDDIPAYILANEKEFLSPEGEFYPLVGGPTADLGGFPLTNGGVTLNDGVFLPGVIGDYDDNGNFVATQENIGGPGTEYHYFGDNYPWSFTKAATFDSDYIKLRDVSITYNLPSATVSKIGLQNMSVSVFSRNIILWTKAGINIDPENAFQPRSGGGGDYGIQMQQGVERYNVTPWAIPVGFKLNLSF